MYTSVCSRGVYFYIAVLPWSQSLTKRSTPFRRQIWRLSEVTPTLTLMRSQSVVHEAGVVRGSAESYWTLTLTYIHLHLSQIHLHLLHIYLHLYLLHIHLRLLQTHKHFYIHSAIGHVRVSKPSTSIINYRTIL